MKCRIAVSWFTIVGLLVSLVTISANAQQPNVRPREFRPGALTRPDDLPPGRLRTRVEGLPAAARERAVAWLAGFHFTEHDLESLEVDGDGGIFYIDEFHDENPGAEMEESEPVTAGAAVPVNPMSGGLIFHSRPGAPNVLYLNFAGENVTGTAWNNSVGRTTIPALPFSTDSDYATFSDSEQAAIRRIWHRVSEDFAPFNVDVTTERPASFNSRTAMVLITRNTDANGENNPSSSAGGVAYVNVFASQSFATYRPAWVYANNLGNSESYIAEATSHELGHNLGLSHDGKTDGATYYNGHGSGDTSWGPLMGTGYNRNVSQWSRGEYYLANNTQDDLATMAGKLSYLNDDFGNSAETAAPLAITGETNVLSTTPANDPANANPSNKGRIERNTDIDVFTFETGAGEVRIAVNPWLNPAGTRGGNVDLSIELRRENGDVVLTSNPVSQTSAVAQTNLPAGKYYLFVSNAGVGTPTNSSPSGYTTYGSIGQYFISGYIAPVSSGTAGQVALLATVNNPAWGAVTPTNGSFSSGTAVQVTAIPAPYFQFVGWTNDISGTNSPITLAMTNDISIEAVFREIVTTNHPTPLWWLASLGYTNNFESAVLSAGANGLPLWQSYVAGLDASDPASRLELDANPGGSATSLVLSWTPVAGRVYTIWSSTNGVDGFNPEPGASNLAAPIHSFTNTIDPAMPTKFFRIDVRLP